MAFASAWTWRLTRPFQANTKMAAWVAHAARKAYPWEHDKSYPLEMTLEVEARIVADRARRPIGAVELITWCKLVAGVSA